MYGVAEQKMKQEEFGKDINEEFEKLYRDNYKEVYEFIYHQIPNKQIAEDIMQDTFYAALKSGETFLRHPKQVGWLMVTAQNKIYELHRKMKRQKALPLDDENRILAVRELNYDVTELELAALAIMSEKEWTLIKDYYLRGIPAKELAQEKGITENNFRVKLSRLSSKLRKELAR